MKSTKKHLVGLLLMGVTVLAVGCGGSKDDDEKEDSGSVGALCREQCGVTASECPSDSFAAEAEDFCAILCSAYEDSDDCREKYQDFTDCLAMYEPACDLFDDVSACDAQLAPFVIDGTGDGNHGECVDEDAVE